MKIYKIKFMAEVHGVRTVSASVLAKDEEEAENLFRSRDFTKYLVVSQNLVETPVPDSMTIEVDKGSYDVV